MVAAQLSQSQKYSIGLDLAPLDAGIFPPACAHFPARLREVDAKQTALPKISERSGTVRIQTLRQHEYLDQGTVAAPSLEQRLADDTN